MDKLSKEDLLKFAKKQTVALKKCRTECEELTKKLSAESTAGGEGCGAAEESLDEWVKEKKELLMVYASSQQALEQSATQIRELEGQVNLLTVARDDAVKQLISGSNQAMKPCTECDKARRELEESRIDHDQLKISLLEAVNSNKSKQDQFKLDLSAVEDERNQFKLDLSASMTERNQLKLDLSESAGELERLKVKLDAAAAKLSQLKLELEAAAADKIQAKLAMDKASEEYNQTKLDLNETLVALNCLTAKHESSESEKICLEEQLSSEKKKLLDTEKLLSELQAESQENEVSTRVSSSTVDALQVELDSALKEKAKLKQSLEDALEASKRSLLEMKDDYDRSNMDIVGKQQQAEAQIIDLQQKEDTANLRLEEVLLENDSLKSQLVDLGAKLEDASRKLEIAAEERNEINVQLENIKDICESTLLERDTLVTKLSDLQSALEELKSRHHNNNFPVRSDSDFSAFDSNTELSSRGDFADAADNLDLGWSADANLDVLDLGDADASNVIEAPSDQSIKNPKIVPASEHFPANIEARLNASGLEWVPEESQQPGEEHSSEDALAFQQTDHEASSISEEERVITDASAVESEHPVDEDKDVAGALEVTALRAKLAEWETMMQLLQASHSDSERDLRDATQRDLRISVAIDDLLAQLETAVKDADLFPAVSTARISESDGGGSGIGLSERLARISTIVDQMCFERDEWRERMQSLAEQLEAKEGRKGGKGELDGEEVSEERRAEIEALKKELEGVSAERLRERKELEEELEDLRTQVEKISAERQAECRKLEDEVEVFRDQLEKVSVQRLSRNSDGEESLKEKLERVSAELEMVSADRDRLRTATDQSSAEERSKIQAELDALRVQLELSRESVNDGWNEGGDIDTETETKKQREAELEAELNDLKAIIHTMTDKLLEREDSYNQSASDQGRLRTELATLTNDLRDSAAECNRLKTEMEEQKTALEEKTKNLEQELHASNEMKAILDGLNRELSERCGVEALKSIALEERMANLVENVVVRSGEVEHLTVQRDLLENELGTLREEMKVMEKELNGAKAKLLATDEGLQGSNEQLEADLKGSRKSLKDLEAELNEVRAELSASLEDVKAVREELNASRESLAESLANGKSLEAELCDVKAELVRSHAHIQAMEAGVNENKAALKDREMDLIVKLTEFSALEADIKQKEEELIRTKSELAQSQASVKDLSVEIEKLKVEVRSSSSQSSQLSSVSHESLPTAAPMVGKASDAAESAAAAGSPAAAGSAAESTAGSATGSAAGSATGSATGSAADPAAAAEVTALQQQLREREDREGKLKQLTLKAKKEATELKNKLDACQKELGALRSEKSGSDFSIQYQSLQTEYDRLESAYDAVKAEKESLNATFTLTTEQLVTLKMSLAELAEEKCRLETELHRLEQDKKEVERLAAEQEQEISAEKIQRQQAMRNKAEIEQQLKQLEEDRQKEGRQLRDQITSLKESLEHAKRESSQSNMLDLELAAYDQTVRGLNDTLAEREGQMSSLRDELQRKEQQTNSLQKLLDTANSQYVQAEDHSAKLKQLLVKAKKDLSEAKKLEGEQYSSGASMRARLEMLTQVTEEQKLEIARLVASERRLSETLSTSSGAQQRSVQTLELRVLTLEGELGAARAEASALLQEYDAYKVRVHTVLKQQKTRSTDEASLEQERTERLRAEALVEQLKQKVLQLSQQLSSVSSELELLQEEHERTEARLTRLQGEAEASERAWRERTERVTADNLLLNTSKTESIEQLTAQSDSLTLRFKSQIQSMQDEHETKLDWYQRRLDDTQLELDRYRAQRGNSPQMSAGGLAGGPTAGTSGGLQEGVGGAAGSAERVVEYIKELRVEERESGEGSESVEEQRSRQGYQQQGVQGYNQQGSQGYHQQGTAPFIPFEQLLRSSTPADDNSSLRTLESINEDSTQTKVGTSPLEKQLEHVSGLLNESEATVLQLTEQALILKAEIRRLERNEERKTSISNMEYLKNIVYKFVTLRGGQERAQLIPVLTTMLRFSQEEREVIVALANGHDVPGAIGSEPPGWGAYLRWPAGH